MTDMLTNMFYSLWPLAVKSITGFLLVYFALNFVNDQFSVRFKNELEVMRQDPRALSDYYGRRLIAAALIVMGVLIGSV